MKKSILIVFLLSILSLSFGQQSREISGKVLDASDNSPLIGATIIVKGTQMGAITNPSGVFKYTVSHPNIEEVTLVVSYVGYKSQSVKLRDDATFEFYLEEDANSLEEVVITSSYGTKKLKQEVVGSISNIKTQDIIIEQSVSSFDELLEGQTAGVYIESSAEVGAAVNIHIRGQGSLTPLTGNAVGSSTQPLIIVDGIIMAEEIGLDGSAFFDAGDGKFSEDFMNPLAKIGIKDIESINVLKDAAAVSLYGADGANGVIVITTKGGAKGPMKFSFSSQGGASAAMNQIEYMNGEQYQELRNLYYLNSGQPENVLPWNGVNTDWYGLLNRTGVFQRYDFSLSGGKSRVDYRASFGYQDIQEPQVNNDFSKYNSSFSLSYNTEKLSIGLKASPSFSVKNAPNTLSGYAVPPTIAAYDEFGNYTGFNFYGNPIAVANQNRGLTETLGLLNSINANYKINNNLSFSSLFGMDFSNKNQDTYFSGLNETGIDNSGNKGYRILREHNTRRWNWNAKLSYNKTIKDHYFDALAGVESRQNLVNYSFFRGRNFPDPGAVMPIETATIQDKEEDKSENTGRSFFSQVNYDFKKKYFLLGNFRVDQSSVFGSDNNTSYNGGAGASWVISNEDFMENVNFLEFLRLRVSYGTSGNSRIGSYRALGLYTVNNTGNNGYNQGDYAVPQDPPNPYLGWEKNYKFNTGIDFTTSFHLSVTVDLFNDFISDMIVSRDVIPEIGFNSVQINGADMYNRGIELGFRYQIISKSKFKWNTQFNVSKVVNKVTHLQGLGSEYSTAEGARAQRIGYSTSVIWGYEFVGIDPALGRELFRVNGEIVDANSLRDNYWDQEYWKPIGNSQPDFFGGLNNRFTIGKSFTIAVNMSYAYGSETMVQKEVLDHYNVISFRNLSTNAYYGSWRNPGDIALYPAVVKNNPLVGNSSKYLYNESRIKLNSVNMSYDIRIENEKNPFTKISVFVNGSNLYYWYLDKSPKNMNGIAELNNVYPEMRTISFGINANF
ncbi:MAG: SusC/RagA family TonB-linked outer membrane protein [Bacteroidales bacterium]|nr:SusC/RagA family TonB-linked outer membrane protein [Bacteroidales bacterium]MCF8391099.1 SusC/RagA family TonB-linked outer membrane protein [Bacteroidales bacterium]